ncbi:MAG: AfsR/SARP family transcriptional regulator, partial [Frankiaceae bacterium]
MSGPRETMHIQLLGGFEVSVGERRLPHGAWRLRKARTLVKLLALQPSHRLHRDRAVGYLWPDLGADAARNNLHQVVHAARRAFSTLGVDGAAALGLQDELVVLGRDVPVVTDVETLQAAVARAGASGNAAALAAAFGQHPPELLPEDAYEPWAQEHADALREWHLRVVLDVLDVLDVVDVVDAEAAGPHPGTAVALLAPVVSANPLNEPAHRAMMRALAWSGRRSEALIVFERLREVLARELAADPEPQTRRLYQELLAGGPQGRQANGPRPVAQPAGPVRLPAAVTPLLGRARELAETDGLLARTRLLTLTGPGGAGKTRLAVELARRRAQHYADGAVLVELGALADGELIVAEMAGALRLELPAHGSAVDGLVPQLRERHLLIVLDNCEHLVDACARVVSGLLRGCPRVTVLATSREPMRIESEVTWRTPSLALPDPANIPSVETLATVASVRLFVDRAAAAAPGFALTGDNAAAVAEICYRLDGMPLAIELAAACVPVLSAAQIAARLSDALTLLSRGDRARITRQQTLAATLAWSHELLTGDEQALFRRLAVFAGSFDLDAVEGICAGESPGRARVLPVLGRLVDTSLVLAEPRGAGTRYRLLETVRQYANERLRAAGEEAQQRHRHCAWYMAFAQAHDPEQAPDVLDVVPATIDDEYDNLRV